eukprot:scaffold71_cov265-Chaetoceros_neogracile.AAC.23
MDPPLYTTFASAESDDDAPPNHGVNAPINVATISSGFEKGDFLVREEKGQRVYFDFFEEAFNYLANKGYTRMKDGKDWMEAVNTAHSSIPNGTRYNTGVLLMVLSRPVDTRNFYNRISQGSVGVEKNIDHDGGLREYECGQNAHSAQ